MDFIINGQGHGDTAAALLRNKFNPGVLRPWIGKDGRSYFTVNDDSGKPRNIVANADATLRKDEWIQLDQAVVKAAQKRLKATADLRSAGLVYTIPNGLAKTILETEAQSDINEAVVSMDGLRESEQDRPVYARTQLPLPIVHKDFSFSARQIAVSRNGSSPLDTTGAELAGRRVAEEIEKMVLGVSGIADLYAYGGGTIYGYTDHTSRNTKTITNPTAGGWTGGTAVTEVLDMRKKAQDDKHFGPYMLYCSPSWDVYMDADFSTSKGDNTLRERLKKIDGILDVRTLDYLTNYDLVLVQFTPDVVRLVVGMEITTVQWESKGGMQQNFKVMAIQVPQLRADYNGNMGLVHGSV